MSQYDDDALRLSDECDGCGKMFVDCDCREDDRPLTADEVRAMFAATDRAHPEMMNPYAGLRALRDGDKQALTDAMLSRADDLKAEMKNRGEW